MEVAQTVSIGELPDSVSITFAITLIVITVLSSILSSIIPITYFIFRRCQGHPSKLIATICLIDLILGYNLVLISLNIYNIESGFHLQQIYSILTLHFKFHPSDVGFCTLNLSLFVILESLSLCFNLCLAFDLIITLTKPFLSGKSREIFYYTGSILITIGAFVGMTSYVNEQCIEQKDDEDLIISDFMFPYPLVGMMLLFELLATLTVIWALIQLYSKKKTTPQKSFYIKQHVWLLFTLMVCYVFPCLNNFLEIFKKNENNWSKYIRNMSFISLLVSGSLVNIVRLMDPYVRNNVSYVWKKIKKCNFRTIKGQKEHEHDDWNGSLNDLVKKFQNQSIIQNILFVVEEVSEMKEEESQLGSSVQMGRSELNNLLYGREKEEIQRAVKLKKTIQTYCVEYKNNNVDAFRTTAIHFQNCSKREEQREKSKHFKIKATAISYYIFEKIRMMDGLTNDELSQSLDLEKNAEAIRKTKQSLGASGSFFFFSYDKRLIIKTITSQEEECLLSFLPEYYMYLCENPHTLLSKIYGIYNVEIGKSSKITFLLMENSFRSFDGKKLIYQIYDMKGSMVNREVKNPNAAVLKDVNFLKSSQPFIYMTGEEKEQFLTQVTKDITMLAEQNIMDYSLLLGVSNVGQNYMRKKNNFRNWKWMDSTHHVDQRIYSLSIIDYLQKFNCQKEMELKFKTFFSPNLDVSCIGPAKYLKRYLSYLRSIIVTVKK